MIMCAVHQVLTSVAKLVILSAISCSYIALYMWIHPDPILEVFSKYVSKFKYLGPFFL